MFFGPLFFAALYSGEVEPAEPVEEDRVVTGTDTGAEGTDAGVVQLGSSVVGVDTSDEGTDSGALVRTATDMVIITRFTGTSGNFPATVSGTAVAECWSGGGGSTINAMGGGGGSYARVNAYVWTANQAWTLAVGTGGAGGGGTGGDTTFQTTVCVAAGAVGNVGGLAASCTGDVIRGGTNGTVLVGNNTGGGAPGSSTAPGALTVPGGPDGGPGGLSATGTISARVPGGGAAASAANQRAGADGLARLIYLMTSAGTHPDLIGAAITRSEANATSHALTLPNGAIGDTLVYCIASDGNPTFTLAGATLVAGSASTTVVSGAMYYYVADGSEPTSLELSASEQVDIVVLRFRNLAAISGTAANSAIANANPPAHDMGSSAATTWITMLSFDSSNTNGGTITARPANYDESLLVPTYDQTQCPALCVAWRDATSQVEDPSVWGSTGALGNVTITAGLRR